MDAAAHPDVSSHDVRHPVAAQRWEDVTMLHWRAPADAVQAHLPDGVAVDTADGSAWVSLVPFRIADATIPPLPPPPVLGTFPETNVRTYVTGSHGPGLWFLSLDVPRLAIPLLARLAVGEAYSWSRMRISRRGTEIRYEARRRLPVSPGARSRVGVEPGPACRTDDLDRWLTNRWGAYSRLLGRLCYVPVRHQPWRLQQARITVLDDELGAAVGLPVGDVLRVHHCPVVDDVGFAAPRPASRHGMAA